MIIASLCLFNKINAQNVITVGPTLHLNLNKNVTLSFGIEVAYWNLAHFPYSIDGGIEFDKRKIRFYTEGQTGIGVIGVSAGPLLEYQKDNNAFKGGFQGSLWANCYLGFDLRLRTTDNSFYICPGTYFKVPFTNDKFTFLGVKFNDNNESHHDWDWD